MIYIASPYSHPNPEVRHQRYKAVHNYAAWLMQQGNVCFSPIVYGHEFARIGKAQTDHLWWKEFNEHMLRNSKLMHVLQLPLWGSSKGIQHEIDFAESQGIPFFYVEVANENL